MHWGSFSVDTPAGARRALARRGRTEVLNENCHHRRNRLRWTHLAADIVSNGHEVVLIARGMDVHGGGAANLPNARFFATDLSDVGDLRRAFSACGAVAHSAGINRELGAQTYQKVHVEGTRLVVEAACLAGVGKIALLSFLRARPNCGSGYHESKWAAEEIVRESGLDYTILKPGVIYGNGDHMLDHLSHALYTFLYSPQ